MNLQDVRNERRILMQNIKNLKEELNDVNDEMRRNGFIENGKIQEPMVKYMKIAKDKFNTKPKDGIKYLIDNQIINNNPKDVVKFLQEPDLNKKAIGEYLGDITIEFNLQVLDAFVRSHDFKDKEFVECLREFLNNFFLPGESQKIFEIMTYWSNFYFESNPKEFNNTDEAYILAYAVIMLNTTLNNPTASRQKINFGKEEVFLKTMLDYDGMSFRDELLRKIYHTIKIDPLKNLGTIIDQLYPANKLNGELWYQSTTLKSWLQRTFVLMPEQILILTKDNIPQIKYEISLQNVKVDRVNENINKEHVIDIHCRTNGNIVVKRIGKDSNNKQRIIKNIRFACNCSDEQKEWITKINNCLDKMNENLDSNNFCISNLFSDQ